MKFKIILITCLLIGQPQTIYYISLQATDFKYKELEHDPYSIYSFYFMNLTYNLSLISKFHPAHITSADFGSTLEALPKSTVM